MMTFIALRSCWAGWKWTAFSRDKCMHGMSFCASVLARSTFILRVKTR